MEMNRTIDRNAYAYKEIYEILKIFPSELVNKIPKDKIEFFYQNMNYDYEYNISKETFDGQTMLDETKAILTILFRDYWATPEQRNAIIEKERKEEWEEEQNKIKIDYDAVFKRNTKSVPPKKETQIVVVEEKKWYEKFVDWIKNIFKRNG